MGIDALNFNQFNNMNFLAPNLNASRNFAPFNFSSSPFGMQMNPYSFSFMSQDFMWLMFEQSKILNNLFTAAPSSFAIAPPTNFEATSASAKKKIASMKLSPQSIKMIDEMSKRLNVSPDQLKALIYAESGGNPQAVNPKGGATGLIQFMPKTAKGLGTSTAALYKMTAEQQLVYVEKYLAQAKRSAGFSAGHKLSAGELYAIVFMPARAKQHVMCSAGSKEYAWNKGLDKNGDGQITITELGRRIS